MTQLYSTGPVSIWVNPSQEQTWRLLGWGERAPNIHTEPYYNPISYDLTGQAPSARQLAGEIFSASATLLRYNEDVLASIQAIARSDFLPGAARGSIPPGGIGSILELEGGGFGLILLFPHAAKAVYRNAANGAMPRGYFVPNASLDACDVEPGTAIPKKVRIGITGLPVLNMEEQNAFGTGGLVSYSTADEDLEAVWGLPWD